MFTNLPGNQTWEGYQMISIIISCTYCSDQRGVIRVTWVPLLNLLCMQLTFNNSSDSNYCVGVNILKK